METFGRTFWNHAIVHALCFVSPVVLAIAQEPVQPAVDAKFIGVGGCQVCHTMPTEADVAAGSTKWANLNEFPKWNTRDKHAKSYELLTGARGQAIGQAIWKDPEVGKRAECISCHCNWGPESHKPERFDRGVLVQYELSKGVTCESCHGPGSLYKEEHKLTSWRSKSNQEKRDKWGMVNVRDPQERAERCLSCHIGNSSEGKVLTHDMYAAGHPPLPGIEIETFAHNMPPHWRYLNDKQDLPELASIREVLAQPAGDLHSVKSVLVGGVMNVRQAAHLVGQQVAKQNAGPEFALFDCAMCHHELRTPSWRQDRLVSARLTPGRPQLHRWPAALVDVALIRAAGGSAAELNSLRQQFESKQGKLQVIFNKTPFGVGREQNVAAASADLVQWLDALVQKVSASRYDRAACEAVLADLCQSALHGQYTDYDSARQLAWAIRTVWEQLKPPPGDKADAERALQELNTDLKLELPWGQSKQILDVEEQASAFKAATGYDPKRFQRFIERFAAAIGHTTAAPR